MKIYFVASEQCPITDEMKDWFEKRTRKHIGLVQKFCQKIESYDPKRFKGLAQRGKDHDKSKFEAPEMDTYIWLTWQYKCKQEGKEFKGPKDIKALMDKATEHHVKSNAHHPESHSPEEVAPEKREDRDRPPKKIVDATQMNDLDIGEMVADWCAMGEEKGNNPKDWADKNVNVRWKFTDKQKNLIYELIDAVKEK